MYFWCLFITVSYLFANVISIPVIQCKLTDAKCIENLGPTLYNKFFEGNPDIGTENLDIIHQDVIDGSHSTLNFKFTNNTATGFGNCVAKNVKLYFPMLGLTASMSCPSLTIYGNYDMHGRLETLPVEGTGDYSITTNAYRFNVEIAMKVVQGKNGKSYVAIKNFRLKPEAIDPVVFDFKNLLDGQKNLADDGIVKFSSENWREVTKEVQDPVFNAFFRKIVKNANKFLKSVPVDELVVL